MKIVKHRSGIDLCLTSALKTKFLLKDQSIDG